MSISIVLITAIKAYLIQVGVGLTNTAVSPRFKESEGFF